MSGEVVRWCSCGYLRLTASGPISDLRCRALAGIHGLFGHPTPSTGTPDAQSARRSAESDTQGHVSATDLAQAAARTKQAARERVERHSNNEEEQ